MKKFVLMGEATCDFTPELVEQTGVKLMPMLFTIDTKEYYNTPENTDMSPKVFYDTMRAGAMPTTSLVNRETYKDTARKYLSDGIDVLYTSFSSALSGNFQNICNASVELREEFPQRTIIVCDTKSASLGMGLLMYLAAEQQKAGKTIEQVAEFVEQTKLKISHWFTVDDLNHLHRGGRLSKTSAVIGTVMGIKPVLCINSEGKLQPVDKIRGRKNSLDHLIKKANSATDIENSPLCVIHGDSEEDANYVCDGLKKLGAKKIFTNYIGPSIGAHAGPGTIGLCFVSEGREG